MAAAALESIRQNGPICGVPSGVETPGLMTGLAGIGYGLLRLAEPRRTPSVLALEPPPRDSGPTWSHSLFDGVMNAVGSAS